MSLLLCATLSTAAASCPTHGQKAAANAQAAEAARATDSRYVVTYRPRRRLADAKPGE